MSENGTGNDSFDSVADLGADNLQRWRLSTRFGHGPDVAIAMSALPHDDRILSSTNNASEVQLPIVDPSSSFRNAMPTSTPSGFEPLCQAVDPILESGDRPDISSTVPTVMDITGIPYMESLSSDIGSWDIGLFDSMQGFNANVRLPGLTRT